MQINRVNFVKRYRLLSTLWDSNLIGKGTLSRFFSKLVVPKATGEVISKTLYGFDLLINPAIDNGVEHSLYYFGTYEKGTLQFIKEHLKIGQSFFDVGANIGLMSLFASQCVGNTGKVYSFEANPETAKLLMYNIHLNQFTNIEVYEKAIGNAEGRIKIYNNWSVNRGGSTLIKPIIESQSFEVDLTKMDSIEQIRNQDVALVKIDVEGFELDVLKGMETILKRKHPPTLIIECSADRNNNYESVYLIYDFVKSVNSYNIFKLNKTKERIGELVEVNSKEELPKHDNIFCIPQS